MGVEVIYIVRHGHRMNWTVDPTTGEYHTTTPTPTRIPCDPELASYGVDQSRQLAERVISLDPPVDVIYSSPFYRCLQTLKPTIDRLIREEKIVKSVRVENGVGEFFGEAPFDHPSPASLATLQEHFDFLSPSHKPAIIPRRKGETMEELHDRNAYALHRIISSVDSEPGGPKAILICTHAASMICMGRALTGNMPDDPTDEDFRCGTCALSKFVRRPKADQPGTQSEVEEWNEAEPDKIPAIEWKNGKGVKGGWDCVWNGDCGFLQGGEERTWSFFMDPETFLADAHTTQTSIDSDPSVMPLQTIPSNVPLRDLQTMPAQTMPAQTMPAQTMPAQTMSQPRKNDNEHDPDGNSKSLHAVAEEVQAEDPQMQHQAPAA